MKLFNFILLPVVAIGFLNCGEPGDEKLKYEPKYKMSDLDKRVPYTEHNLKEFKKKFTIKCEGQTSLVKRYGGNELTVGRFKEGCYATSIAHIHNYNGDYFSDPILLEDNEQWKSAVYAFIASNSISKDPIKDHIEFIRYLDSIIVYRKLIYELNRHDRHDLYVYSDLLGLIPTFLLETLDKRNGTKYMTYGIRGANKTYETPGYFGRQLKFDDERTVNKAKYDMIPYGFQNFWKKNLTLEELYPEVYKK